MSEGCTPELVMEHERRITEAEQSTAYAHHRMDNLEKFTESVQQILIHIANLGGDIKNLTTEVKNIAEAVAKHDNDIADIHKEIEPRDSINRIHGRLDEVEERLERREMEEKDLIIAKLEAQDTARKQRDQELEDERKRERRNFLYTVVGSVLAAVIIASLI